MASDGPPQGDVGVAVARVDAAAGEHVLPGREGHGRLPAHDERLRAVRGVAHQHDGGRAPGLGRRGVAGPVVDERDRVLGDPRGQRERATHGVSAPGR